MTNRILLIVSGAILLAGGIFAIFAPVLASLAATLIVGWTFILAGIMHIVQAFRDAEDRLWNGGFGLLGVLLGLSFLINPLGGMVSLALLLGAIFFATGVMQLYLAWKRRATDSIWMLILSGIISVVLALMIAFNLFTAAVTVPGFLLGLELISTGIALILLRPKANAGSDRETQSDAHA